MYGYQAAQTSGASWKQNRRPPAGLINYTTGDPDDCRGCTMHDGRFTLSLVFLKAGNGPSVVTPAFSNTSAVGAPLFNAP